MRFVTVGLFILFSIYVSGQEIREPSKLPLVPYAPGVEGVDLRTSAISINSILKNGLKVILADRSFKVIQFDVVYDCHSRSLLDFSSKRYQGDRVPPDDKYMRARILSGDLMDIVNTVIEKNGVRYCMKEFSFIVTN